MCLSAAVLALSAALLPAAEARERISVRADVDVLDRLSGLREALARWHPRLDAAWVPDEAGMGFTPLFDGSADLLVSFRGLEPRERALAAKLSLEIDEHVAALDALAVVVHRDNRVESLSIDQVVALFGGKIVGWYGFGGSQHPVRLLSPSPSSGEHQALRALAPGGDFRLPAASEIAASSPAVLSTVASDPGAVGLVSMSFDRSGASTVPLSAALSGSPVVPSPDSVERGGYPLRRALRIYSRVPADEAVQRLVSCILSSEGQAEIAKAGFVPVSADRPFRRMLPARERSRSAAVTRVSFEMGSDRFDRAAGAALSEIAGRAAEVWITGHAALGEDRSEALALSARRARAVSEFLSARGVAIAQAEGVGAEGGDLRGADVWWIARR